LREGQRLKIKLKKETKDTFRVKWRGKNNCEIWIMAKTFTGTN